MYIQLSDPHADRWIPVLMATIIPSNLIFALFSSANVQSNFYNFLKGEICDFHKWEKGTYCCLFWAITYNFWFFDICTYKLITVEVR